MDGILIVIYLFLCLIVGYALFVWYIKKRHSVAEGHYALQGQSGKIEDSEVDPDLRDHMESLVMSDRDSYRSETPI